MVQLSHPYVTIFLITALLRTKSHSTQLTYWKCAIHVLKVDNSVFLSMILKLWNHYHNQFFTSCKRNPIPFSIHTPSPHFLLTPSAWARTNLFFICIDLAIFHIDEIIQYVVFFIWPLSLSRFLKIYLCCSVFGKLVFFMAE